MRVLKYIRLFMDMENTRTRAIDRTLPTSIVTHHFVTLYTQTHIDLRLVRSHTYSEKKSVNISDQGPSVQCECAMFVRIIYFYDSHVYPSSNKYIFLSVFRP